MRFGLVVAVEAAYLAAMPVAYLAAMPAAYLAAMPVVYLATSAVASRDWLVVGDSSFTPNRGQATST